jgi:hypothetical protein
LELIEVKLFLPCNYLTLGKLLRRNVPPSPFELYETGALENHHLCGGSAPHDKVVAPFVVDGPMTRAAFLAYLEQCLGQHSSAAIDNLPAHKGVAVEKAI